MFRLMPDSYYSFQDGVRWVDVALQMLVVDFYIYVRARNDSPLWWVVEALDNAEICKL